MVLNETLRHEVEERKRAEVTMHRLQGELVQANKLAVLGQITAGVAHEINQPVAAIQTNAENALAHLSNGAVERASLNLDRVLSLTQRIGAITADLKGFARRGGTEIAGVPLQDAIASALRLLAAPIRQAAVRISNDVGPEPIMVRANKVRLEQVMVNLLQNALEALEGRMEPQIILDSRSSRDRILLSITDNGPGLSHEAMNTLFTPFSTTKPQGLGLGLVICKDIMAEFGGALNVRQSRSGARFELMLRRMSS
jgi:two-component system C4-dicarboxylate transport sensor histidine kinase DctB